MGMFDKAKNLYKLQRDAKAIKNKLKNIHIEAEVNGVLVTINGEQKVVSVDIQNDSLLTDKKKLATALLEAFNKGLEKSQKIAAEEMKEVMGSMGLA